ncbi:GIY-YIG nuclease family protein [Streptomyces sp. BA2]|uniref:GIY-YIG nuclease family protein n=1 Tax=Streptomyces sp. BA2 TaxID=436595 RepID=UPI00132195AB|nr:GIY-YIG nuclease family protein [Streptomyces sp. BA2]MWA08798.1 hypothetical protein [Streptomyces sp. BA2]
MFIDLPPGPIRMYEDPYDPPVSYSYPQPGFLYQPLADHPDYWVPVRALTQEEIEATESERARERRLQKAQEAARAEAREAADNRRTSVYRLRNEQGDLLYVGISATPPQRWAKHATEKEWWPEVVDLSLEWFATRTEALAMEAFAIRTEKPRYNVTHNQDAA